MKVFCIGLSRTGTTSLCDALHELGLKTLHYSLSLYINQDVISPRLKFKPQLNTPSYKKKQINKTIQYLKNNNIDFFQKYDVFGDLPIPNFYKELYDKFPDAKFIYSHRDQEKWVKSMEWLFTDGAVKWRHGVLEQELNYAMYNTVTFNEEKLRAAYRKHHDEVMNFFSDKPDSLLIIDIDHQKLTYDLLKNYLNIQSDLKGDVKKNNSSIKQNLFKRVEYSLYKNVFIYSLIYNFTKKVISKIK